MPNFLGIDTSNYTTSVALFNTDDGSIRQEKKLLPVKFGELGIRQSDAVFHHTRQLPLLIEDLFAGKSQPINGIGVSVKPRADEGSYMPCFLAGSGLAHSLGVINALNVYETTHQVGHILAALYSINKLELVNNPFVAFHFSGGTTDCLYCTPNKERVLDISLTATSLDLKVGQAVDRVGVMLGLQFPCGKELEKLALQSSKQYRIKPTFKGENCCLSGVQNKCAKMLSDGETHEDIARYCLEYISVVTRTMTVNAIEKFGNIPIVYAGGVMSNSIIREHIMSEFDVDFAKAEFSCDNASGTAVFAGIKSNLLG